MEAVPLFFGIPISTDGTERSWHYRLDVFGIGRSSIPLNIIEYNDIRVIRDIRA